MSEQEAERLYGAAPEGDEATDASREVPDPGDSPSYALLPQPFAAAALNGWHLGRQMRITDGTNRMEGQLSDVRHGASKITESPLGGRTTLVLGDRWVQVEFLMYGGARIRPEATVELLD
jgi:hypothetical protein